MPRRIRKQIYIEPEQEQTLKRLSAEAGQSEAELIRNAIDQQLRILWFPKRELEAWDREVAFIKEWMGQGVSQGQRTWRREDVYER